MSWYQAPSRPTDEDARRHASDRQRQLTKPPGALGRLENLAIHLAALQGSAHPQMASVAITVFAADHGVATAGVSAFPQAVTTAMIRNFVAGGAAISVLARQLGAQLEVVDLGTVAPLPPLAGVRHRPLGRGTQDFRHQPAMTANQLEKALEEGRQAAERACEGGSQLFIGGEMGIGNTTAATALACVLLDQPPQRLVGPGTGLDQAGITRKTEAIATALARHPGTSPLMNLRCLGGFEIAALVGAFIRCAQIGLATLVDGFITSVAALIAVRINPGVRPWLLFSHLSPEPGHHHILDALAADPLLDLNLRLGEGSGAAVAVPLLRLACALHNDMATFAEAGVPCR